MRFANRSTWVATAMFAAIVVVPQTANAAPTRADKARAAGITVDPGAEKAMAEAPAGTCLSDPNEAKCPKVTRIAAAVEGNSDPDFTAFAFTEEAVAPSLTFAAGIPQCFVKSDPPFFAAGLAQGNGAHTCTTAASYQELYVTLYDYISTGRRSLDVRSSSGVGGQTLRGSPKFDCNHATNSRQYETEAFGYSVVQGTGYSATQKDFATFKCPY